MIASLLVAALAAAPAALPSGESLVGKFLVAAGGAERLREVQAIRETGSITVTDPGRNSTGPSLLEEKRPNKSRVERSVFGAKLLVAYDGRQAWTLDGAGQPQLLTGSDAREFADNEFDHFLLDYAKRGIQVSTEAIVDLPSGPAYKLRVVLRNGAVRHSYLDKASFLEVRRDYDDKDGGSIQWFKGQRRVGGVMRPTEYVMEYPSGRRIVVKVTPEVDPAIDDARFSFPAAR